MIHVVTPIRQTDPVVLQLLRMIVGPSLDAQHEEYRWTISVPLNCRKRFLQQIQNFARDRGAEVEVVVGVPIIDSPIAMLVRPNWAVGLHTLTRLLEVAERVGQRSFHMAFEHGVDYHLPTGLVRQVNEKSGVCCAGFNRGATTLLLAEPDDMLQVASKEPMWLKCVNGPEPPWEQANEVQRYFGCDLCGPSAGSR